jgi:hypothetical protein
VPGLLTFDDTDLDFMLFFNRILNKKTDIVNGALPVYPSAAYSAVGSGMSVGEGYIYNAGNSHFLKTTAGSKISINKNLVKTAASKFTFAFKIRYGITDAVSFLFEFDSPPLICGGFLGAIGDTRRVDFQFYNSANVGYAQTVGGVLPATESDVLVVFQSDGTAVKVFVNGTECSYGWNPAYSGGNLTFTNLLLFNANAAQCYWCAFFNDAISQARITALAALPNNLNLYGYASADNTGMALRTAIPVPIITAPTGAKIGSVSAITWSNLIDLYAGTDLPLAKIELSRDGKSTWETLTSTATGGTYNWTVTGAASTNCYLRVSDPADATNTADSGQFAIASTGGNGGLVGGAVGAFAAAAYLTRKWWTRAFR